MRKTTILKDGWTFLQPGKAPAAVSLPHTWNALDGQDGGDDYRRCVCGYTTRFAAPAFDAETEQVYLQFDGVNASAEVELNGRKICCHDGGYSTFRAEITDDLAAQNTLSLTVDNTKNATVYPQKADFTFYGGIYREVTLLVVPKAHFALEYHGGTGVAVTATPTDGYKNADVTVQTRTENAEDCTVEIEIFAADGSSVAKGEATILHIEKVRLWDGVKAPYLYTAVTRLLRGGVLLDEICTRFGVRDFSFDAKTGFTLNGRPYPLHGVSRHQDRKGIGNALTREMHEEDMAIIREVGANSIRLAHYQHSQAFYDLCDEYGMVVWAEIPYISEHMPDGRANTLSQMTELIIQNYNHPCIVTWGLSNEITISTKNHADMMDNHRELNALVHKLDPHRPTTLACYAMCLPWDGVVHKVSDLVGYNLYLGWYVPGCWLNDAFLSLFHLVWPQRPLCYSEYGAEGMPNLHSAHPHRGDHTEEYQAIYHEYMLRCFARHKWMWGSYVWNMFDFAADARDQGGEPGMNHKGLVTFDRKTRKDSFYLYKAWWSDEPFVHICGKRYADRTGSRTTVKVYSNQPRVTLTVNGKELATQTGDKVFLFKNIPLTGEMTIEAKAGQEESLTDTAAIRSVATPNPAYKLHKKKSTSANWV